MLVNITAGMQVWDFVSTVGRQGKKRVGNGLLRDGLHIILCKLYTKVILFLFTRKENDLAPMDTSNRTIAMVVGGTYTITSNYYFVNGRLLYNSTARPGSASARNVT